ncbi:MAG: pyruvate dehydrogenase complex dihydrolipoamide acetyltransferase [Rickettsiaceae bacterium]|nr:pyruvate dehydrogenase complex dihydrolipoamide acetyltransferase [Rickettsiaceae bacterium]
MIIEILMPALSPTMTEGNLAKWLKKEGEKVKPGDVIAEIETDKATMEVEAVDEGFIGKILVHAGSKDVKVGAIIALIIEEESDKKLLDDHISKISSSNNAKQIENTESSKQSNTANNQEQTSQEISDLQNDLSSSDNRIFASPLARRIANQNNINLALITGSGPHGRIIKEDVVSVQAQTKGAEQSFTKNPQRSGADFSLIPITNIRKVIATRLLESKLTVPHFYLTIECNIDKLLAIRSEINESRDKDHKISVNDFMIKATALSLHNMPEVNTSWSDDGIIQYKYVDISVAVALDGGLITPIIKDANLKSLSELSKEMKELAQRAKNGKLMPHEYQGGGFSISNLGMYGVKQFAAIINPPQSGILAIGAGQQKPIVYDDKVIISTVTEVTLSCDHRVVDGVTGARFLSHFKDFVENPVKMLI